MTIFPSAFLEGWLGADEVVESDLPHAASSKVVAARGANHMWRDHERMRVIVIFEKLGKTVTNVNCHSTPRLNDVSDLA